MNSQVLFWNQQLRYSQVGSTTAKLLARAKEARYSPEEDEEDSMEERRNCYIPRAYSPSGAVLSTCPGKVQGLLKSHRVGTRICQLPCLVQCSQQAPRLLWALRAPPQLPRTYLTRRWNGG